MRSINVDDNDFSKWVTNKYRRHPEEAKNVSQYGESNVLLAACGCNEEAFETSDPPRGRFTVALLEVLKANMQSLTYQSLMAKMPKLDKLRCFQYFLWNPVLTHHSPL